MASSLPLRSKGAHPQLTGVFLLVTMQTYAVLDDLFYNVIHDLLLKVHRDEKMARASTAAIRVEKLASDASESSTPDSKPDVRIETDAAIYEDGKVVLKGNPLKTTTEILCPRCHLPRLLHPTDGKGARKPDPSIIYCKKHPYIDKPSYDIYGQTWVAPGPGRGKKKKDMEKKLDPGSDAGTPAGGGSADQRPPNVLSFPSATCSKCKRCILVTRLNNHMGSCIGNSGRNASRAAAQKISNGGSNGNASRDATPPSSQKGGSSQPGSRAASPRKRDADEAMITAAAMAAVADGDDDESESALAAAAAAGDPKKKKLKPTPLPKKVILKTKGGAGGAAGPKKEKARAGASSLSQEHKFDDDDDDDDGRGDDVKAKNLTVEVAPKKSAAKPSVSPAKPSVSPAKKLKLGQRPPPLSSPASKNGRDPDAESESSGTLSSPPQ